MSHNSLRKFDQPLSVELSPSRFYLSVLVSLYSLAILAWWNVPLSGLARLLLTVLLTGHFFHLYREYISATSAASVQALSWDRVRGWRLRGPDTVWLPADMLVPVFVSYRLAAVRFRTGRFRTRTVLLFPDRLPANDFRRLRVRLLQSAHGDRDRKKISAAR
ncbi:MAG: hypothetical protein BMS9Abin09_0514 [Gammaproteobacteria bacterium]|nr:MAG: hypothetical protein BMS9Abin09_0514 [Gammaproteobacteria bacterium]